MGFDDACNTGLVLGLGLASTTLETSSKGAAAAQKPNSTAVAATDRSSFEPSLTLALSGGDSYRHQVAVTKKSSNYNITNTDCEEAIGDHFFRQASPRHSAVSSFSSGRAKRERDLSSEELEVEKVNSSRVSDEEEDGVNTRKKLRLTKEQSALLEQSFKQQSTLNPKQKQALARQLNLRPRQVEVWFQNRRARTKLKQTEVDCELLRKRCETLMDENRRLQKELQELKALKLSQPFYMHMPPPTLTICPSCERIAATAAADCNSKSQFSMAPNTHFFTNPSAAC